MDGGMDDQIDWKQTDRQITNNIKTGSKNIQQRDLGSTVEAVRWSYWVQECVYDCREYILGWDFKEKQQITAEE